MRVFGIIGNCRGKNLLVPQLVSALGALDISISTLKRVSDDVDLDRPGKESYAHRQAGAREVMIANSFRWALMSERAELAEPELDVLLRRLAPVDLVLVEGFHLAPIPKCEIVLADQDRRPSYPDDPSIVALISDTSLQSTLPLFSPYAIGEIAEFILAAAGVFPADNLDRTMQRRDSTISARTVDWQHLDA
jgi:molybdopterin-guanine dinucleotide biosynthesis protein B